MTVDNSSFAGNTADYQGGGISNGYYAVLGMTDSTVSNNISQYGSGGGLYLYYGGALTMSDSTVSGNTASYSGGGLYSYYSTLSISDSTIFSDNVSQSGSGGGLYLDYGNTLTMSGSKVSGNRASYSGGGLYSDNSTLSITSSTVSENENSGIVLNASYAQVQGNTIADNLGDGIYIEYGYNNTIGTNADGINDAAEGNIITGNTGAGVAVAAYAGASNSIRGNVINSNGGLAIDLGNDGRTPNDPGDGDYGPNNLQNFPIITSLTTGTATHVTGTLNSTPDSIFTIDIYAQTGAAPVNPGSSIRYLGSVAVTTDASGNATFDVTLDGVATSSDELVSATATDFYGNTSEFSDFNLIQVAPVAELSTSEGGAQATFSVVLAIQPTANVTVALSSSDTTEGTVSPASLTFTPGNWNHPQVATITGVDDTIADGLIQLHDHHGTGGRARIPGSRATTPPTSRS